MVEDKHNKYNEMLKYSIELFNNNIQFNIYVLELLEILKTGQHRADTFNEFVKKQLDYKRPYCYTVDEIPFIYNLVSVTNKLLCDDIKINEYLDSLGNNYCIVGQGLEIFTTPSPCVNKKKNNNVARPYCLLDLGTSYNGYRDQVFLDLLTSTLKEFNLFVKVQYGFID